MTDAPRDDVASAPAGTFPREAVDTLSGLQQLRGIIDGTLPPAPISRLLDFHLCEVDEGRAVFRGTPRLAFYNPLGSVHGGWPATLLDSALGCSVHATLAPKEVFTTLEFKVNIVRPIYEVTGEMTAAGRVLHRGRRTATADATLVDAAGRLYAHASTTCIIMPAG